MTTNQETSLRERFEHWMLNVAKCVVGSSDPYPAGLERDYWKAFQAGALAARAEPQASAPGGEVTDAAYRWWLSRRPLAFNEAEHLANPGINTCSDAEKALAKAVAAALAARTGKGESDAD